MKKRASVGTVVCCLVAVTLLASSCGSSASTISQTASATSTPVSSSTPSTGTPTSASPSKPRYGGTITLALTGDVLYWNPYAGGFFFGGPAWITNQFLWSGDWTKGPAGGYGSSDTDWAVSGYDLWEQKVGDIADSWKWTVDTEKDEGTIVYQIREGIQYALNPDSEASRLVGGRELTADDVVASFRTMYTNPNAMLYRFDPPLRTAQIAKTGPWEVSVKVPLTAMELAIRRFGGVVPIFPQEVLEKYSDSNQWDVLVGTGPFMVIDYVPGSVVTYDKNDRFGLKDPIGPGKGNQLPYIDRYKELIIPDASTRQAALRTGKVDQMTLVLEDAAQIKGSTSDLAELEMPGREAFAIKPVVDQAPFNDVRVRRALMMATDFEAINQGLHDGKSQILNYPIAYYPAYSDIYLGLDDPEMPESVKDLYTYNPEKAKELLKEAGYPNGFKTTALMDPTEVDIYSVYRDMWAKAGIELEFDVREVGAKNGVIRAGQVTGMTRSGASPIAGWSGGTEWMLGSTTVNPGRVDDPLIDTAMAEVKRNLIVDPPEARRLYKELLKYVLDQAYAIPVAGDPQSRLWWPWLKNYSGEFSVGYWQQPNWIQWVWVDQNLKSDMGH